MVKNSLFPIPAEPLKYDTYADFPSILPDGTLVLDLSTDKLYTYDLSTNTYLPVSSGGQVNTIVAGAGISIDSSDPRNPIVTATVPSGITDHSLLSNLDYISSGHTGFQPTSQITKNITYNLDGTVNVITDAMGTKTMAYNLDGTLASITCTGVYKSKTFTYSSGVLTDITIV